MIYQVILAMDSYYGKVSVEDLNSVCATILGIENTPDEYGMTPLRHISYYLMLRPLTYLGLVVHEKDSGAREYDEPKDVILTDLGRWLLNASIREEWAWIKT